jgi:hypothetical protein
MPVPTQAAPIASAALPAVSAAPAARIFFPAERRSVRLRGAISLLSIAALFFCRQIRTF